MEFSGDISATFAEISKVISPANSANISTSNIMDEIIVQNPTFFGVRGSPFGVVDIWWVETAKRHNF